MALGDLNEWRRHGPVHEALSSVLPAHQAPPTWPSRRPFVCMDRIYASAGLELLPAAGAQEWQQDAARASDHLPLVVDLVLREAADDAGF
ncbi:MAG: hypothetical protein H7Y08_10865 [Rhizobiaceae bacterium]|nr:hypothetical protein [Rhizobiaceae bacterium]